VRRPPDDAPSARPQALAFPDEPFRATPPGPRPARPFHPPPVQTIALDRGVTAYLVEQHTLPTVAFDLVMDGGALADPAGAEGLAVAAMTLVGEGTEALDTIALGEALADVASSITTYASGDTIGIAASTLARHLDETFALFADLVGRPGLRGADLERLIERRIEGVRQARTAPGALARRIAGPVYYGPGHRFGRPETEATLGAITVDACRAFVERWLRPAGARLFVLGDLTADQLRALWDGPALAGWSGAPPPAPAPPPPTRLPGRIFLVDAPGAAQSVVGMRAPGPRRDAPDFAATAIMAAVLGGGFASRLNMNLREARGITYGARGGFGYDRAGGVFSAGAQVRADATAVALTELHREVRALAAGERPATATEIEREQRGAILGLPARFATGAAALRMYRSLIYHRLPLDDHATFADRVQQVTPAAVDDAARRHLAVDDAVYVVVGDAAAPVAVPAEGGDPAGPPVPLRDALAGLAGAEALGAGALVVLDADGRATAG
jgi:predicted Zn-dependent peptidase